MIFCPRSCIFSQDLSLLPTILIDGNVISCIDTSKFLEVLIDERLNRKPHINQVIAKINRNVAVISRIRYKLDAKTIV